MHRRHWRIVNKASLAIPGAIATGYIAILGLLVGLAQFDDRAKIIASKQLSYWLSFPTKPLELIIIGAFVAVIILLWIISYNKSDDLDDIDAKVAGYVPPSTPEQLGTANQSDSAIVGVLEAAEEDQDTFSATGTLGLTGLYVGNIIVAAGSLESEHRVELAIIGYNGSGELVRIGEISGHINAGAGNLRDMEKLPIPAVREMVNAEPGEEFVLILNQHLPPTIANDFLAALNEKHVQLDLSQLTIKAVSVANTDRWMALPLWDAVSLRRRDDIVSNRVTVLRVGTAHFSLTGGDANMTAPAHGAKET